MSRSSSSRSKKLSSMISKLNPFKDEKRRTYVSSKRYEYNLFSKTDRTVTNLEKYEKYYSGEGTVWAAINSIGFNTTMSGYNIKSDNPEAKKVIEKFCRKTNLSKYILNSTIFALIYGDAFGEIVYKKNGEPVRLKGIDPKTMFIDYDVYGDVNYYYQKFRDGSKGDPIDREYIHHLNLFPRPGSPYGISLVEPSRDTIYRKVKTDEAIANSIERHGFPKYVLYVGTEDDFPSDDEMDYLQTKFEDISHDNEFILTGNCKLETVDDGGIQGVDEYFGYFQAQLVTGLLCPEEALGLGRGSTEATASTKAILYERMIKAFQLAISHTLEEQVFRQVLDYYGFDEDTYVKIDFKSVTDKDEAIKARWMANILRSYSHTKYRPFTINEIREMLGQDRIDVEAADRIDVYEDEAEYIPDLDDDDESRPVDDDSEEEEEEEEDEIE